MSAYSVQTHTHPCFCQSGGDPLRSCSCTPHRIKRYQSKISGPLLDRIDIHIEVPAVKFSEVSSDVQAEPSSAIRARVTKARAIQNERFKNDGIYANAQMKPRHIRK